ncbi:MAG: ABC transporter permease [Planctomycetota bacterium]
MGFLLHTAAKDLRRRMRDPMSFLMWLGIPLAIAGMIKLAFGGGGGSAGPRAEVLVADLDGSFLSGLLLGAMGQQQGQSLPFEAEKVGLEEGRERIDDGDGSALLIIPEGFGEAVLREEECTLRLITNPAQRILPGMVEEALTMLVDAVFYLHRVFGEPIERMLQPMPPGAQTFPDQEVAEISVLMNDIMGRLTGMLSPPAIELVTEVETEEEDGELNFGLLFFPSMLFMTLFFLAQGIAEDIWVEKQGGTLRRVLTTPNRAGEFLAGKLLTSVVLIAAVSAFGLLLARVAFSLDIHGMPLAIAWCGFSGALLTLMMILVQLFASSQRAGNLLANLVMMPLLMLGGSFFPFEVMPDGMAAIGRLTPNGWALEQLKSIVTGAAEPARLALAFGGLTAVGALLFVFSTRRMSGAFARS